MENFISCDVGAVAKPALPAYQMVWDKLGDSDVKWFAAAHMWDVAAATKIGFRGAWSSVYEQEPCFDVFGDAKLDVVAGDLLDMAREIVKSTSR